MSPPDVLELMLPPVFHDVSTSAELLAVPTDVADTETPLPPIVVEEEAEPVPPPYDADDL
ncbi:hypothetical protein FOMPIDRAFT_1025374 [Fomitopsis schrenkii]|uniref:Uncharacterized protein n=1 Tax=Fomitopsis schrenkii TaxID=2126942 RepID=S8FD91_FOMSC|nr:hypothetical protein FOMPIDRAFT_1025374 [Fomitopsis schrenkii]